MGILDRMLGSPARPAVSSRPVPGCAGAVTAHRAWAVVAPAALALDPRPELTLVTSGLDLDGEGRSRTWEFIFFLPTRSATVMLSLEPDSRAGDVDAAPCVLTQRLSPATPHDARKAALPQRFRDSPEVVAELAARGADFVAGPTDMKLEGRVLPSGEAAWVTYLPDRELTAAFGAP